MNHQQMLRKFQRRYLLNALLFTVVASGIVIAVFAPFGLISKYYGIDLSFLLLPFLGFLFLQLIARQFGVTLFLSSGDLFASIVKGIALAFAVYFLFSRARLLERIPLLESRGDWLENLSAMAGYLVIFIAGYTLTKIAEPIKEYTKAGILLPVFAAAGWMFMGLGIWLGLSTLASSWSPFEKIGLVVFAGMLFVAMSRLGRIAAESRHSLLSDAGRWLTEQPGNKFLIAGLIAVYFVFIREFMFSRITTAYLIEWLLFCLLAWRIFAVIKEHLEKSHIAPVFESAWQRHEQRVDDFVDEDFNKLVVLQEDYAAGSSRREILEYIRYIFVRNGYEEDEIGRALSPILEYHDRKIPWYAFGWWKKRIIQQNRLNRRKTLQDATNNLAGIPLYGKR